MSTVSDHNAVFCELGDRMKEFGNLFPLSPPVRYSPPVRLHMSIYSKILCYNMNRASGECEY